MTVMAFSNLSRKRKGGLKEPGHTRHTRQTRPRQKNIACRVYPGPFKPLQVP